MIPRKAFLKGLSFFSPETKSSAGDIFRIRNFGEAVKRRKSDNTAVGTRCHVSFHQMQGAPVFELRSEACPRSTHRGNFTLTLPAPGSSCPIQKVRS